MPCAVHVPSSVALARNDRDECVNRPRPDLDQSLRSTLAGDHALVKGIPDLRGHDQTSVTEDVLLTAQDGGTTMARVGSLSGGRYILPGEEPREAGHRFRNDTDRHGRRRSRQLSAPDLRRARGQCGLVPVPGGASGRRAALRMGRVVGAGRAGLDGGAIAQAHPRGCRARTPAWRWTATAIR